MCNLNVFKRKLNYALLNKLKSNCQLMQKIIYDLMVSLLQIFLLKKKLLNYHVFKRSKKRKIIFLS